MPVPGKDIFFTECTSYQIGIRSSLRLRHFVIHYLKCCIYLWTTLGKHVRFWRVRKSVAGFLWPEYLSAAPTGEWQGTRAELSTAAVLINTLVLLSQTIGMAITVNFRWILYQRDLYPCYSPQQGRCLLHWCGGEHIAVGERGRGKQRTQVGCSGWREEERCGGTPEGQLT